MTRASIRQAVLAVAAWNKGRAWPSSGKAMGLVVARSNRGGAKGRGGSPRPGLCEKATFLFYENTLPTPKCTSVKPRDRWATPGMWAATGPARLSASCWTAERPVPSPGEALGWAGPRDNLRIQGPSVVAQFPHVLGHHVEEERDKALGAHTGHWGQKAMSAGLGRARA